MSDYVIFDTETTGLVRHSAIPLKDQPRIVEFAAIRINAKGKEVDRLDFLVNPGIPIPTDVAAKSHKITDDDVARKRSWSHHVKSVAKIFWGAKGSIAHNLSFDMALVNFAMARAETVMVWPERKICTVEETVHILGRRMKLNELHAHLFEANFDGAHRAMNDVEALKKCVLELVKRGVIEL